MILFNPIDVADGHRLRAWFDQGGKGHGHHALNETKLISAVSLSTNPTSMILFNPIDVADGHRLRAWFDQGGKDATATMLSSTGGGGAAGGAADWSMIGISQALNHGWGEKPDYVSFRGTVVTIKKDTCMYQACPSSDCNKKVIDQGNGSYRCEKCNKEFPDFNWRYIMNICLADMTDSQWVTCFQESAEALLGISADELGKLRETDEDKFNRVFAKATYKTMIFKCRVKTDHFNEETRVRYTALSVQPDNLPSYNSYLSQQIEKFMHL